MIWSTCLCRGVNSFLSPSWNKIKCVRLSVQCTQRTPPSAWWIWSSGWSRTTSWMDLWRFTSKWQVLCCVVLCCEVCFIQTPATTTSGTLSETELVNGTKHNMNFNYNNYNNFINFTSAVNVSAWVTSHRFLLALLFSVVVSTFRRFSFI